MTFKKEKPWTDLCRLSMALFRIFMRVLSRYPPQAHGQTTPK